MTRHEHWKKFQELKDDPPCTAVIIEERHVEMLHAMLHSFAKETGSGRTGSFLLQIENGTVTLMDENCVTHWTPSTRMGGGYGFGMGGSPESAPGEPGESGPDHPDADA